MGTEFLEPYADESHTAHRSGHDRSTDSTCHRAGSERENSLERIGSHAGIVSVDIRRHNIQDGEHQSHCTEFIGNLIHCFSSESDGFEHRISAVQTDCLPETHIVFPLADSFGFGIFGLHEIKEPFAGRIEIGVE